MKRKFFYACSLLIVYSGAKAQYKTKAQQLLTSEDSLNRNINNNKTVISGYGSAFYQRDFNAKQSTVTLERAVLFVGHQFNEKISFFSELEIENAKVEGSEENEGEVAMEQAYLRFNLDAKNYFVAGLFVPRIGILNENHLPVNFNGVERPIVETLIIPATWRELGAAFYGSSNKLPLSYSIALMNGLNSANLEHGSGIREARAEGSLAPANNLVVTASLQYFWNDFKFQVSGYAGGTVGLNKHDADSLGIGSGAFGTPFYLGEADFQYSHEGLSAKAIYTLTNYPGADKINKAYGKNVSTNMYGSYIETGYDLLHSRHKKAQFIGFLRAEFLDMNAKIPYNATYDGSEKQTHIVAGFCYLPIPNVVIKTDVRLSHNNSATDKRDNQFLNIGIGYSF